MAFLTMSMGHPFYWSTTVRYVLIFKSQCFEGLGVPYGTPVSDGLSRFAFGSGSRAPRAARLVFFVVLSLVVHFTEFLQPSASS
jgi:hypothetical protein